jgi:hypothetical protein
MNPAGPPTGGVLLISTPSSASATPPSSSDAAAYTTHEESVVLAERLIGAKTNEVPEFAPLLRGLAQRVAGGVGGCVFTMDAAHTVRARRDVPKARKSVASLVSCVSSPLEPP